MKTLVKILLGLVIACWTFISVFFVIYLCREMDWAIAFANWLCGIFGKPGKGEIFLTWLGGFILWFSIGLAVFTLILIVLSVTLFLREQEEKEDANRMKLKEKKASKKAVAAKKEKAPKAKKAKEVAEPVKEVKASETKSAKVDSFLKSIKKR